MPRSSYTKEQVLAEATALFDSMDFSDEGQLGRLTYAYARNNYPWFSSAITNFGKRSHDWYGALEALLSESRDANEVQAAIKRIRAAGNFRRTAANKSRASYSSDGVRAEFRKLVSQLDFTDSHSFPLLVRSHASDNYDWYSSAMTHFGIGRGSWYGAVVNLLSEIRPPEEAKEIVEKVKKAGTKNRTVNNPRCAPKYSSDQVKAEFSKMIEGMDLSNDDNLQLLTLAHAQDRYPWFSSACRLFGKRRYDWYGAAGKLLAERLGSDKAGELIVKIRKAGQLHFIGSSPANKPKFGPSEVREALRNVTACMDFSDERCLMRLTSKYACATYPWFSSARTHFGTTRGDWYGPLETLLSEDKGAEEARAIVQRVKLAGKKRTRARFSAVQVREESRQLFSRIDFSDESQLGKLTYNYAQENFAWFSSACTLFGNRYHDWYGALERLLAENGGAHDVKAIVERVKTSGAKAGRAKNPFNKPRFSSCQVRGEFRKLIVGMDFSDESQLNKLTHTFADESYPWFSSAGTLFGKSSNDWYGALGKLLAESVGADKAKDLIMRIRKIGIRNRNLSSPANKPRFKPIEVKTEFRKIAEGMDFSDERQLGMLTYSYARDNYAWFSSACTIFGNRSDDWYGALGKLLAEDRGPEEARAIVDAVRINRRRRAAKGHRGTAQVILVPSQRLSGGKSIDFSPFVEILASAGMQVLRNGKAENGNAQKVVLSVQGAGAQTEAQRLRFGLGSQSWETIAAEYVARFSTLAPFIIHHLAVEKLLSLAKKGQVSWPESILSQASGVSELHLAFQGLRRKIEAAGFMMPRIVDLDITAGMLRAGANPVKVRADMREMPFAAGAFAMVENSSLYQCRKPETIKAALLDAAWVTSPGGSLMLSSANRPFSAHFHSALAGMGYEPLSAPNDSVALSEGFLSSVSGILGESFASKLAERVKGWHILVAVKSREGILEGMEEADAELFRLGRIHRPRNPLLLEIGQVSRAAFNSSSLEDFDAGISAILGLLKEMETAEPKGAWRLYDRIARLEKGKLAELGADSYSEKRGDVEARGREFLERLGRKNPANDNRASQSPAKRKLGT